MSRGRPNEPRSSRYILKDYVNVSAVMEGCLSCVNAISSL